MKVHTIRGELDYGELEVRDVVLETRSNHRKTATEWYHKGELVRRDVNINLLAPLGTAAALGNINGQ